ncbi:MAG TPA: hypothetical protein VI248_26435 [Kineosporiaceae bacterium]
MIIDARFNGPPASANGGYAAGVIAAGERCEVTLRRPVPLGTPLARVGGTARAADGALVAEVAPIVGIDVTVPPVSYQQAVAAAAGFTGFTVPMFPTCFVCGPERADGLRIFPGRWADGTTAAPWTVPDDVTTPMVWAALDCPGGWSVIAEGRPYLLGRIAAVVHDLPTPGGRCVVRGALAETRGRKALTYSTLYGPDGAELARARATWIAVPRSDERPAGGQARTAGP